MATPLKWVSFYFFVKMGFGLVGPGESGDVSCEACGAVFS